MTFCTNCGQEITAEVKFCGTCGKPVTAEPRDTSSRKDPIYDGNIHKCPNCGEMLDSFTAICPVCNYELRGTHATSCVHELSQKLEKTESIDKKAELISNFYIPNTKEDIYEFFILAYSNITAGGQGIDAWKVKLEQAYLKAKLAFGGEDYKHIQELYDKITKESFKSKVFKSRNVKGLILFLAGLIMMVIGFLGYEIAEEFDVYLDGLITLGVFGVLPFLTGIIMFISPEKKKK